MCEQKIHFRDSWRTVEAEDYLLRHGGEEGGINIVRAFPARQLHELFLKEREEGRSNLKILDVGTGPTLAYAISAAQYASEIVLSDYSESFRCGWMDGDPTAHDWSGYFKYVVEDLEGKTEKEAKERETQLRKAIKAVVPCDITTDPPLPPEYMGPQYDLVTSILCLESACQSKDAYREAVSRLYHLVKPGGRIAVYGVEREDAPEPGRFDVRGLSFHDLRVQCNFIREAFQKAGFTNIDMKFLTREELNFAATDLLSFVFVSASKMPARY